MKKFLQGFLAVFVVFSFLMVGGCTKTENVVHQGKLLSFQPVDGVFDTYEGELILHGLTINQEGIFLNKFKFSTGDDQLAKKIEESKGCWAFVELTYDEKKYVLPWNGSSKFVAKDVKCLP